jgi:hypothetical protein
MAMTLDIPASGWATDGTGSLRVWNLTFRDGGWTSRIGAEPFPVDGVSYAIDGLWALPGSAGLFFSSGGALRRVQDEAQQRDIIEIRTGVGSSPQGVLPVPGAVLAWGGDAPPIRIDTPPHGWPYGTSAAGIVEDRVQPLYIPAPAALNILGVNATTGSTAPASAGSVNLWNPAQQGGIAHAGQYGLGWSDGGTSGKPNKFDYVATYVGPDGSESAPSPRATVAWEVAASATGYYYCVAIETPPFPDNVIGMKVYRTGNYAPNAPFDSDQTLRFVGVSYSPDDTHWVDTVRGSVVGADIDPKYTPAVGRPTAMTVSGGRLWSARDQLAAYTDVGYIAQYRPENYVPLPPTLGTVVAMADLDGFPLVLGSKGIVALSDVAGQVTAVGITGEGIVSAGAWCYHQGGVVVCSPARIILISGNQSAGFQIVELSAPIRSAWAGVSTSGPVYATSAKGILHVSLPDGTLWLFHGPAGWSEIKGLDVGPLTADEDGDVLFGTRSGWGIWCLSQGRVSRGAEPQNNEPYVAGAGLSCDWRSQWQSIAGGSDGALAMSKAYLVASPTGGTADRWSSGLNGQGRPPDGDWPRLDAPAQIVEGSSHADAQWGTALAALDYWPMMPLPHVTVPAAGLSRAVPATSMRATSDSDVLLHGATVMATPIGRTR